MSFSLGIQRPRSCALTRRVVAILWASLVLLLAVGLTACEPSGAVLTEAQYQAALVGNWQGNVGQESESISFSADGSFSCQVRSNGFIGATLGQGTTGTIRGTWALQGDVITLALDHAGGDQPLNLATDSTIVSFRQDQLLMKSRSGETSTFNRAR